MSMSRRVAALSIAAALTLPLAACSSPNKNESSTESGGQVTLTISTFNEFGYDNLFNEYMEAHPNIKIEHRKAAKADEARNDLNTRMAAGSGLSDVVAAEGSWLPELMQYPDKFVDLTSPSVEGRWLDWKSAQATDAEGHLLGYGTDSGPTAVCYRRDLFEKAGLPSDREEVAKLLDGDWDHLFEVGRKFTAASGIPWYDSTNSIYEGMLSQVANAFENSDGTPIPLKDNTQVKGIYDKILGTLDISAKYSAWSEDWTAAFQKDGFGTILCPSWMLGVVEGNAAGKTGWDVANVFPGGGSNSGGSFLMVPKQSKHPDEAKAFADWLTAPEQQIKAFKTKGNFPSQVKALEDPALKEYSNEFFNNAPVGSILVDRAKAVQVRGYSGPHYAAIRQVVGDALTRVETGVDDADASWQKALQGYDDLGLE